MMIRKRILDFIIHSTDFFLLVYSLFLTVYLSMKAVFKSVRNSCYTDVRGRDQRMHSISREHEDRACAHYSVVFWLLGESTLSTSSVPSSIFNTLLTQSASFSRSLSHKFIAERK